MKDDKIFQERRARINELRAKNEKMSCRERALMAVKHKEPDRVPIDNWMVPEIQKKTMEYFGCENYEELLDFLGVDFRNNYGPSYVGQILQKTSPTARSRISGGSTQDGYLWEGHRPPGHLHGSGRIPPGEDEEPGGDRKIRPLGQRGLVGLFKGQGQDCESVSSEVLRHQRRRPAGPHGPAQTHDVPAGHSADSSSTWSRTPRSSRPSATISSSYFIEYNHQVFKAAEGEIDIFMMGDDIGAQTGPLLSLDMWRRYFKNAFKTYIDIAHQYGIPVMYHTCGDVKQFLPDFIECGLDILQSLQPKATQHGHQKAEEGIRQGHHASRAEWTFSTSCRWENPQDVAGMAKYALDSAKEGGGYIICTAHNIQIDTPIENVAALFEAYHEYGKY